MSERFTLHEGDCLDAVSGMAGLADGSVDHVICDPPFEAHAHSAQRRLKRTGWRSLPSPGIEATQAAPLTFPPITESERDAAALHMARCARRWIVVFCQIEAAHKWIAALEAGGAVYKRTGIWRKPNGQPQLTGDRPGMGYETIVIAHAPGRSRWNGGGGHAVWTYPTVAAGCDDETGHQTQKPIALMEALITDFTDPGELILDPFAGSGTTGVAALRLGRRFIGWEKDPKYAAIARRRLGETKEQARLFEGKPAKREQLGLLAKG